MFEPERSTSTLHRRLRGIPAAVLAGTILLLGAGGAAAQDPEEPRPLVAHEVSVSGERATLVLEFHDGERLEASLRDGALALDGQEVGPVEEGSSLAEAWRSFLAELAPLAPAEAGERIRHWELPEGLEGEAAEAGQAVREAMASAVADAPPEAPEAPAAPPVDPGEALPFDLSELLGRTDRLAELPRALEGLELDDPQFHVGENVRVEAGQEIAGGLVVLDGNLVLEGRVDGHVVVLGGSVDLEEGASVTGNLTVTDGTVRGDRAAVEGSIVEGLETADRPVPEAAEEAVEEAVEETREPGRNGMIGIGNFFGPLAHVWGGLADLIGVAISAALLALIGLGLLHFAPRNLDLVARASREDTGRSALVGLATIVLAFPLWVAGIVALAVSVIGIPLLLIWIPLFWAALGLIGLFGFVAAAYQLGEWMDERRFEALEWMRGRSAFHHLATGVAVLLSPFALAAVVSMAGPFLSWMSVLLTLLGWLLTMVAVIVGTGAVLLTRGGRQPSPPVPPAEGPGPGDPGEPTGEPAWSTAGPSGAAESGARWEPGRERDAGSEGSAPPGSEGHPSAGEAPGEEGTEDTPGTPGDGAEEEGGDAPPR